jgi:hypothetical protein
MFSDFAKKIQREDAEILKSRSDDKEKVEWLELIASLHFLATKEMPYAGKDAVRAALLKKKPQFNDKKWDIDSAWKKAKEIIYLAG